MEFTEEDSLNQLGNHIVLLENIDIVYEEKSMQLIDLKDHEADAKEIDL